MLVDANAVLFVAVEAAAPPLPPQAWLDVESFLSARQHFRHLTFNHPCRAHVLMCMVYLCVECGQGNTKNQRKQMRRQMQGTLEATIAHLKEIAVNAGITDRADAPGWDDGDRGCSAASGSSTDADDSDDEQHAAWLNEFVPSLSR